MRQSISINRSKKWEYQIGDNNNQHIDRERERERKDRNLNSQLWIGNTINTIHTLTIHTNTHQSGQNACEVAKSVVRSSGELGTTAKRIRYREVPAKWT